MHPELLNNSTFLRYFETWQRNPKSLVFASLADFYCQHKLYADARKVCESGVRHNPDSVLAHYSLAKAYLCTREWHSARHEAQWVLAHASNHQGALEVLQHVEHHQAPARHMMVEPAVVTPVAEEVAAFVAPQEPVPQDDRFAEVLAAAGGSSSPLAAVVEDGAVVPADDDFTDISESNEVAMDRVSVDEEAPLMMRRVMGRVAPSPAASSTESPAEIFAAPEMSPVPAAPVARKTPKRPSVKSPQKLMPWQTVTMAKIYSQQGFHYKARAIYKAILSRDPQNAEAKAGLATLERTIRDAAA